MTTSAVSSTTATTTTTKTAQSQASSIFTALKAGSGVDTQALAQSLVDAERMPKKALIDGKITKDESRISGYGSLISSLSEFKSAFATLQTSTNLNSVSATNSGYGAYNVSLSSTAKAGNHTINVVNLAQAQRSVSLGYPLATTDLSTSLASSPLIIGGTTINVTTTTPQGIVDAVNSTSGLNVTAQLINTGDASTPYRITLTASSTGASNAFSVSGLDFDSTFQSSNGFASKTTALNSSAAFGVNVTLGSTTTLVQIPAGQTTPQGIVDAVNAASLGVTAQLVDTGNPSKPWKLAFTPDETGGANAVSVATSDTTGSATTITDSTGTTLAIASTPINAAQDALVAIDGLAIKSSTNTVSSAITGVTLNLATPTGGATTLSMSRDTTAVKENITALAAAYNKLKAQLDDLSNASSNSDVGGSLANNSIITTIRQQMISMTTGTSSTPGTTITSLSDLGVSLQRNGTLKVDNTKLDTGLSSYFDDVVTMFSNNEKTATILTSGSHGLAGDAIIKINKLISSSGPILSQSSNAASRVSKYKDELLKLEDRMSQLLTRYQKQFSAMNSLVGDMNSLQTSLKSQFDSMLNSKN